MFLIKQTVKICNNSKIKNEANASFFYVKITATVTGVVTGRPSANEIPPPAVSPCGFDYAQDDPLA